jgi:hypothetical protein
VEEAGAPAGEALAGQRRQGRSLVAGQCMA